MRGALPSSIRLFNDCSAAASNIYKNTAFGLKEQTIPVTPFESFMHLSNSLGKCEEYVPKFLIGIAG